jgi:protein-L-isoaspartate(D-aspartate) O-methyltransferase
MSRERNEEPKIQQEAYAAERAEMVHQIERETWVTQGLTGRALLSPRVLAAMGRVPRHEFVPEDLKGRAYDDGPLPIGYGQTISQPFVVALMTDLAALSHGSRVLEVGTGCGYQTAALAELATEVFTIEIVPELAAQARVQLMRLGYTGVKMRVGDGYLGWSEHAPFDAIVVAAAAPEVPPALLEQLKPGGRLVIPVGRAYHSQELLLIENDAAREVHERVVLPVAFVPLVHALGAV